ncbi:MAG: response regulator transcription factor [Phycisphaerales bacterium]|nr:MAG: response regulator transcription factor [Phycisphaerales bacterium]
MCRNDAADRKSLRRTRILIVENHPVIRQALVELVNQQPDLMVCAEADSASGISGNIDQQQIDMAIIDLSLKGSTGACLVEELRVKWPSMPILVLSLDDHSASCERAFKAGAMGYVVKHEIASAIVPAIRQVLGGKVYISEKTAARLAHAGVNCGRFSQV